MSRAHVAWILLGFFGILAALTLWTHRDLARTVTSLRVSPTGYVELVNRAMKGKLVYRREAVDETIVEAREEDADRAVDRPDRTEVLTPIADPDRLGPGDRTFLANSFLLEDLEHPERFQRVDQGRGSDQTARLRSGFRSRRLPYSEAAQWHGRLMFRGGRSVPVLRSRDNNLVINFEPADGDLSEPQKVPFDIPVEDGLLVFAGNDFLWQRGHEVAFRLFSVPTAEGGSGVVLRRPGEAEGSVRLNGTGESPTGSLRALLPGDWLVYSHRNVHEVFFLSMGDSGVISDFRRGPEGFERSFEESWGLESLAEHTAMSMDRLVSFLAEADERNDGHLGRRLDALKTMDLRLTMDASVQAAAQELIDRRVHKRMPKEGWSLSRYPRLPPKAVVSVSELHTGDLLAAASYPGKEHLDAHLDALRDAGATRFRSRDLVTWIEMEAVRRKDRLTANHVFDGHQVGSTIKPLLAAASALAWEPGEGEDPLSMTVQCAGGIEAVDGEAQLLPGTDLPLGAFQDAAHGVVDFPGAIKGSCNTFIFHLGAKMLREPGPFDAESCTENVGRHLEGGASQRYPSTGEAARAAPTSGWFAWLTGARLSNLESAGPGIWNQTWWDPLADTIRGLAEDRLGCEAAVSRSLASISPAVVDLKLGGLNTCHPHFSSFLKGGASNRWSNADLANAYARFINGAPLQGRILLTEDEERVQAFDPSDCSSSLACADPTRYAQVRRRVLEGMAGVLSGGGTAGRMRSVTQPLLEALEDKTGSRWGAYGKTGTSEREVILVKRVDELIRPERHVGVVVPVANFTLILAQCADDPGVERAGPIACNRLPEPGQPVRGFVVHVWVDGIPEIGGGEAAASLLRTTEGKALLNRLVEAPL